MGFNLSRDKIFNKIRSASSTTQGVARTPDFSSPIYPVEKTEDSAILFAENFTKAGGKFIYCETTATFQNAFIKYIKSKKNASVCSSENLIKEMIGDFGIKCPDQFNSTGPYIFISSCESLIASEGGLIVSSNQQQIQSPLYFNSEIHIVIAFTDQILYSYPEGLRHLQGKYQKNSPSLIYLITGSKSSSNTANIQKEVLLFLIDETGN